MRWASRLSSSMLAGAEVGERVAAARSKILPMGTALLSTCRGAVDVGVEEPPTMRS